MNTYKCPDCGGYQYTANTQAAGSRCIYCDEGRVILFAEGTPPIKKKEEPRNDEQEQD